MHDIFVSYARRDLDQASAIVRKLSDLGFSCFFDVDGLDAGDQFPDVIDTAVKSSKCVVGLWTAHALTRDWVKSECRIGARRGILVTGAFEQMDLLTIPTEFGNPHLVDLSSFNGDASHRGFIEIVRAVAEKTGRDTLRQMTSALSISNASQSAVQNAPSREDPMLRAAWEDLRSSVNPDRIIDFRDKYAKGTLLEFAIAERLETIAAEFIAQAEALYPTLDRKSMLNNFRSRTFWAPARRLGADNLAYLHASAYDRHANSAHEAFRLFKKAAELEHPIAMAYVAVMLQSGIGVSKDAYAAGQWFAKANSLLI